MMGRRRCLVRRSQEVYCCPRLRLPWVILRPLGADRNLWQTEPRTNERGTVTPRHGARAGRGQRGHGLRGLDSDVC